MKSRFFGINSLAFAMTLGCMNQTVIAAQIYNQDGNRISLDGSFKARFLLRS